MTVRSISALRVAVLLLYGTIRPGGGMGSWSGSGCLFMCMVEESFLNIE